MENASKALLIAGGMLLAMLLVGLVIINYNQIVEFYNKDKDMTKTEQIAKFNSEYTEYNRKDVRGSDLLSLVNKVVDYNKRNDETITITITIEDFTNFYYKTGSENGINYDKLQDNIIKERKGCY